MWPLQDGSGNAWSCLLEGICPQLLKTLLYLTKLAAPKGSTSEGPQSCAGASHPAPLSHIPSHGTSPFTGCKGSIRTEQAKRPSLGLSNPGSCDHSCRKLPGPAFRLNLRKGFYSFERRRNTPNAILKNHLRSIFTTKGCITGRWKGWFSP